MVASSPEAFAAAVRAYELGEVALAPDALAAAGSALRDAGLLLLGEPHGVAETPRVLYALATRLGTRALALEWSHEELDGPVQAFLRTGRFDFERLWALPPSAELFCGDGRITAGHFALLERLRGEGRLEQVLLFDRLDSEPPPDFETQVRVREPELAARLLAEWDRRLPLLAVAGAFHAQLDAPEGLPLAGYLARELPGLRPAMLDYVAGRCFSRGELHDVSGPMPDAPIRLPLGRATPAVVPGR